MNRLELIRSIDVMFVVFPYHNNIFVGRLLIDAKVSHDMDKVTGSKETKQKG